MLFFHMKTKILVSYVYGIFNGDWLDDTCTDGDWLDDTCTDGD